MSELSFPISQKLETQGWQIKADRSLLREDGLPFIMGILNVTPDSFSDGGDFLEPQQALEHALKLQAQGADIIDVGAESSRPGAQPLSQAQEWERLKDLLPLLADKLTIPFSIDSYHLESLRRALEFGCAFANDIYAGRKSPGIFELVADAGISISLMHMQGTPQNMQENPRYQGVCQEVYSFLQERVQTALDAGILPEQICVDPGFGFGKRLEDNIAIINNLEGFGKLGRVMAGVSRKSSLADLSGYREDKERLPESLAAAILCMQKGAEILRVHDVEASIRALRVAQGLSKVQE